MQIVEITDLVKPYQNLPVFLSLNVDPYIIIDAFQTYKIGEDFFSQYLDIIERHRNK